MGLAGSAKQNQAAFKLSHFADPSTVNAKPTGSESVPPISTLFEHVFTKPRDPPTPFVARLKIPPDGLDKMAELP